MKVYCPHCGTHIPAPGGRCAGCGFIQDMPPSARSDASQAKRFAESAAPVSLMACLRLAAIDCARRPYVFLLPVLIILANEGILQSVSPPGAGIRRVTSSTILWLNLPAQSLPEACLAQLALAVQQIGLPVVTPTATSAYLWHFGGVLPTTVWALLTWMSSSIRALSNALQWRIQINALPGRTSSKPLGVIWTRLFLAIVLLSLPAPVFTWVQYSFTFLRQLAWLSPSTYTVVQIGFSLVLALLATLGMAISLGGETSPGILWVRFFTRGRGGMAILSSGAIIWGSTLLLSAGWYLFAFLGVNLVGGGPWAVGLANEILTAVVAVWICQALLRIFAQVDLPTEQ